MRTPSITTRTGRSLAAALLAVSALSATAARAQGNGTQGANRVGVRAISGGFIPTGDLRDDITDAGLYGAQLTWQFQPNWAVVGTFGWAPTGSRTLAPNRHLDLYQYDLGLESRLPNVSDVGGWQLGLFAGAGLGGRTYSVRNVGGSDSQFDGYGALGFDIAQGSGPLAIRAEARDYLSSYKGVQGQSPDSKTRNDVVLFVGLGLRF